MVQKPQNKTQIQEVTLDKALGERYLSYALSTIMARSLPDVRDGLKPVNRRILFAMKESGNTFDKSYRKSASAVGYVMMKYHPHGNDPIYEAMVRMAQDFSYRYPLVDGQGNFGSLDGDNAAAMRYTEARLALCSNSLLEGIDENAVDFQETYNGETREPTVLPAAFPNLLANGATGIAVGMATNVPPHNVDEICQGLLALLNDPQISINDLVQLLPGPDFPTGGVIIDDKATLTEIYANGRGSIRLRARWEVEELKGGQYQIVVTEIPYQIQKARLIEKIADTWAKKKLPLLGDIQDESTTNVRIVLTPKSRTVEPTVLMESLFRLSDLETRFSYNMNLLDQGKMPRVMSLKDILQAFLDHRRHVLCRRSQYRVEQISHRLEILAGYLVAFLNLDEVIRIIREEDDPKAMLINRWQLTDVQAEAILNMRLRALRKLEEIEIRRENDKLQDEKLKLEKLLQSDKLQAKAITQEIKGIQEKFGNHKDFGRRRTTFAEAPNVAEEYFEATLEREPLTVVCSEKGWIRVLKGHLTDTTELKYKEGDQEKFICTGESTDKIILFATNGRFYTLSPDKLPGGRGHGEPVRMMINMDNHDILAMIMVNTQQIQQQRLLVVSADNRGFIVKLSDVMAQTKGGKQVLNVPENIIALGCYTLHGDAMAMISQQRKLLIIKQSDVPEMARGRGVILQKIAAGPIVDIKMVTISQGLQWQAGEKIKTTADVTPWLGKQGQSGKLAPTGFPRSNKFGG